MAFVDEDSKSLDIQYCRKNFEDQFPPSVVILVGRSSHRCIVIADAAPVVADFFNSFLAGVMRYEARSTERPATSSRAAQSIFPKLTI